MERLPIVIAEPTTYVIRAESVKPVLTGPDLNPPKFQTEWYRQVYHFRPPHTSDQLDSRFDQSIIL